MRIAGTSYTESLVNQLNSLAARQYDLQNQISTGQRVRMPGDDPGAMAHLGHDRPEGAAIVEPEQVIEPDHVRDVGEDRVRGVGDDQRVGPGELGRPIHGLEQVVQERQAPARARRDE